MKTRKKLLAFLLVLTLIMTSLPAQLFANEVVKAPINLQTDLLDSERTTPGIIDINPNVFVGNGYMVEFKVNTQWEGAFNGEFILTNTGEKALENWALTFDFEHEISNMWNAQIIKHEGSRYTVKNLGWNQDIAPGSSVGIGFGASWNKQIIAPAKYDMLNTNQQIGETDSSIEFKVVSDWGQAFNGQISITNNSDKPIEDWTLAFDFDRNIDRFWTAEIVKHEETHYIIKNLDYNANIAPGQTLTLGFAGNPGNVDNEPSGYKLTHIGQQEQEDLEDYYKDSDEDELEDYLEKEIGSYLDNKDSDEDGLQDGYEYYMLETSPIKADTDGNGLMDGDEDFDNDGLTNLEESQLGTNPYNTDTDNDGLTDADEVGKFNTDPLVFDEIDTELDSDNDGLADGIEMRIGTDLYHMDTDGDSLPDGYEFSVLGLNPLKQDTDDNNIADGDEDFDNDRLSNIEEYRLGTDSKQADTDNDKLTDGDEVDQYQTNPLLFDTDEDTIGDGDELVLGLNPLNPATHGIPDNEFTMEQKVSEEALEYINTEDNPYTLSIDVVATGNARDNVVVETSNYAKSLSTNEAVVGKVIQVNYFGGEIKEGTLSFKLDEALIGQAQREELEGLKQYYVFTYDAEINAPVPVPTTYDEVNNTLVADMIGNGTYYMMDLEKLYTELGILESNEHKVVDFKTASYASASLNTSLLNMSEEVIARSTSTSNLITNKKVDLVFVVDTGYTIETYLPIIKESLSGLLNSLINDEKMDLNIAIIDYKDIARGGTVKINETLASIAEGDTELSFTKDINKANQIISNLTASGGWDLNTTPLAGLGYAESLPYRQDAQRFTLLVTDKLYRADNEHGYLGLYPLLDKLNEKKISLSVATLATSEFKHYDKWTKYSNGISIQMYKLVNFAGSYFRYILDNLSQKTDFRILASNTLKEIHLEAPLEMMGSTDTDKDDLTDSQEVKWHYIDEVGEHGESSDGSYALPTLGEIWIRSGTNYDVNAFDNLIFSNELKDIRVLPLISDPTLIDSDDDGLLDIEDEEPFINTLVTCWLKFEIESKIVYVAQEKFGENNLIAKICETGSNTATLYQFNQGSWNVIDQNVPIPNDNNKATFEDGTISKLDSSREIVIDLAKSLKVSEQEVVNRFIQLSEFQQLASLGITMGVIDSFLFPQFTPIFLPSPVPLQIGIVIIMPPSGAVKELLLMLVGTSEEELEKSDVYLTAKIATEYIATVVTLGTGFTVLVDGIKRLLPDIKRIIAGGRTGVAIAGVPGGLVSLGGSITVDLVEVEIAAKEISVGLLFASASVNAGKSCFKDFNKLQGLSKGKIIGSVSELTPDELRVVNDLVDQGKIVEIIPTSNQYKIKTPDFKVDGVRIELKTLKNPNTNTGMTRIQEAFKQDAQGMILDGRNANLTSQQAEEILSRVKGKFPNGELPGTVEIWTNGGIITYP